VTFSTNGIPVNQTTTVLSGRGTEAQLMSVYVFTAHPSFSWTPAN